MTTRADPHGTHQLLAQARLHRQREDWNANLELLAALPPSLEDPALRYALLDELWEALFQTKQYARCLEVLAGFARTPVDDRIISRTDRLLPHLREGRKVVATLDPSRVPGPGELIIRYGDYPLGFDHLICNNPASRNLRYFWNTHHDQVEYDPVWEPIDCLYLINLDERPDRYLETLRELKRMRAPFSRIRRFAAYRDHSSDDPVLNGYIGCTRSHLEVVNEIVAKQYRHALVLEDDFCFVEDLAENRRSLERFFARGYDYDVCLLAASNVPQWAPHDELLVRNHQDCTTTSAYLLSSAGARRVQQVWQESFDLLLATRDTRHIADQSWARLQKEERFFTFQRKLGFQRPGLSCITQKMVFDLD
jgi:hypothetical protein